MSTKMSTKETVKIPFKLSVQDKVIAGYTKALTQEGLRLISARSLKPGTPLNLQFSFRENVCHLNLSAHVTLCTQRGKRPSDASPLHTTPPPTRDRDRTPLTSPTHPLNPPP